MPHTSFLTITMTVICEIEMTKVSFFNIKNYLSITKDDMAMVQTDFLLSVTHTKVNTSDRRLLPIHINKVTPQIQNLLTIFSVCEECL